MIAVCRLVGDFGQHVVHGDAKRIHGVLQPGFLAFRFLGDRVGHHDARLVKPDMSFGDTFLSNPALEHVRQRVSGA